MSVEEDMTFVNLAPRSVYDPIFGATFVGLLVAALLFGIAGVQTFLYFRHSGRDNRLFKIVVAVMSLLNCAQLCSLSIMMYDWLVTNFGNIGVFSQPEITAVLQVVIAAATDMIVRGFFARRVYILCGPQEKTLGVVLYGIIMAISLAVFGLTSTHTISVYKLLHSYLEADVRVAAIQKLSWLLYTFYGLSASADLLIAITTTMLLSRHRIGFKRTDDLITFYMMFSMNSGLVTSVIALVALVVYATHTTTLISLGISFVLSQLHVNSLLVSLNARGALRQHGSHDPSSTTTTTGARLSLTTLPGGGIAGSGNPLNSNLTSTNTHQLTSRSFAVQMQTQMDTDTKLTEIDEEFGSVQDDISTRDRRSERQDAKYDDF